MPLSDIPFEETRSPEPQGPSASWALSSDQKKKAAWRHFWVLEPILGGLNYGTHHALRLLTVAGCSRFGAMLAPLAQKRFANSKFSQRLAKNIKALRPDLGKSQQDTEALLTSWWENIGRVFAEYSVANRLWSSGSVELYGEEHISALRAKGQQIIFVSVHLGSWEGQMVALCEALGMSLTGPFQPEPSRFTNRLIYNMRKRRGAYLFPPGQRSAIKLHKLLRSGELGGLFYIDDVREKQIHVPLFGRPAPQKGNAVAAIKLAMATGAAIVPSYMVRTEGSKYRLQILPPIEWESSADRTGDIEKIIEKINSQLEPIVLEHLDQWYMLAELRLK